MEERLRVRPSLAGREEELSLVSAALARRGSEGFGCVLISGEPGIGKTRLAQEIVASHGTAVRLATRAYPLGNTVVLGTWADALDRHLRELPTEVVRSLSAGYAADLSDLLPSVAAASPVPPRRDPPRLRLLQGLGAVMAGLAKTETVVVFLDDMHNADSSSWEALGYLGRSLRDRPVMVIVAVRPAGAAAQEQARRIMSALDDEGLLLRLKLGPLDPVAIEKLAADHLGTGQVARGLTDWLMDRTRGNPLFAHGLLDALLEEGADRDHPHLARVPEALADRVRATVRQLDTALRETIELMALVGQVDLDDLVRLSSLSATRLGEILDQLEAGGLVVGHRRASTLIYEISHPLVQEAIYDGIGPARSRLLHRQVARGLLGLKRLGAAAPHFALSASVGDAEAVEALVDAMRAAESSEAYREAFLIQEALLELVPAEDSRWLDVLDAMASSANWLSDHRADDDAEIGVEVLRRVAALVEGGSGHNPARVGAIQFRLAHYLGWGLRDAAGAERACAAARDLFEAAGDHESALLAVNELAFVRGMTCPTAEWLMAAHDALRQAEEAESSRAVMFATGQLGIAQEWSGRLDAAESSLLRSLAIATEQHNAFRRNWSLVHLAITLACRGSRNEAKEAIADARRSYSALWETITPYAAWVEWVLGDYPSSVEAGLELMKWTSGSVPFRSFAAAAYAGGASIECDRLDESRSFLDAAAGAAGDSPWFGLGGVLGWFEGLLAHVHGDGERALGSISRSSRAMMAHGIRTHAAFPLVDLAEIAAREGEVEMARYAADCLRSVASDIDCGAFGGLAVLGGGWAALVEGDRSSAARAAELALDTIPEGWWGHRPRAAELLGLAHRRSDPTRAARALGEAVAGYDRAGATRRRDRAADALAGLGARGRRTAGVLLGPASLSGREREVVRHTLAGGTAQEVADRLFISRRTVESHLAGAYAKLGVSSKKELLRRADDLDPDLTGLENP